MGLPRRGRKEDIMGQRAYRVMQESNRVRKLFYGSEYPCKVRDCQYGSYISDNKSNDAVLDSALSGKGIKLIIAPPGSGKSTAILSRANELVANNKDYRVVFDLPTRALTLQMGNHRGVRAMVGGDSFDEKSPITATTYEKMYEVENHIMNQRVQGTAEKDVLVLDESHLLTTQHTFRQDAIRDIIRCIEKNYFHSIVLVTATPEPMSLFHCDEVLDFQSTNKKPSIDRLEIIETDDPIEYIKGLDYSREFPFIRLNNTELIDSLIAQMPQTMARLTKDDRKTKTYLDIVEHGRIDGTGINGILATSVIEAGVSITDYPDNIVPIAVFPDNNISTDDIEQFLNRIRAKGNRHVECARVVVRKPKQKELKVSLSAKDGEQCILEFQDIQMEMGNLTINDTGLLYSVADGEYRLRFEIGESVFYRHITVSHVGKTTEKRYSKSDTSPMVFKGIGFRQFFDILRENYGQREILSDSIKALGQFWEEKRRELNLSGDGLKKETIKHEMLIRQMASGYIHEAGEIGDCLSFADGDISIDKRVCFEVSYRQFMRQYYHNHDLLAEELKFRLDTDVVLMEQDTEKGKSIPRDKEDIWDGIEDLRQEIESSGNDLFWRNLMGKYDMYCHLYSGWKTVCKVREQEHLMEILKGMEKEGITGKTALRILTSSKSQRKIKEYVGFSQIISYNQLLEQCGGRDIGDIPCYRGRKKGLALQAAIYCYLEQKGVQSPMITKQLKKEVQEYYRQSFPDVAKLPTERKIGEKMTKMYKSRGKGRIDRKLRTNMEDIFNLVASDYQ